MLKHMIYYSYKNKKTQLTIFIIIGIILIIGIIFLLYNKNNKLNITLSKSDNEVYDFVLSCYKKVAEDGMREIGRKGVWLYFPKIYSFADEKTFGKIIPLKDGFKDIGNEKFVYWFYFDDKEKKFQTNIPMFNGDEDINLLYPDSDYSIKSQLNRYINENMEDCINNFNSFRKQYDIYYNPRDLKCKISFKDDKIYLESNFKLRVRNLKTNETKSYNKFYLKLFNSMKRPYFHALALISSEFENAFIDKKIWDILTTYQSSRNRKDLPPTSEFSFNKFDLKPWITEDVKNNAKKILEANLPLITFKYSINKPPISENELINNIYKSYYKDFINFNNNSIIKEYPELASEFVKDSVRLRFYSFFPMYLSLGGDSGDYLYLPKAESFLGGLIPFFWTKYNTEYTVVGPVLLEIVSYYNNNLKYEFNVPIEFNIKRNKPLRYALSEEEFINQSKKFYENLNKIARDSEGGEISSTIICNPSQFISKRVYFNLTDPVKESGIKDAIVMFNCKGIANCYVGKTKEGFKIKPNIYASPVFVNKTYFSTRLPINCYPGNLTIFKIGYKTINIGNLNPNLDNTINLGEIEMPSAKNFKIRIEKGYLQGGAPSFLEDKEIGIIIFESLEDKQFIRVIKQDYRNKTSWYDIDLIPGKYKVYGILIYNNSIDIPADEVCYDPQPLNPFNKEKCEDLPAIHLDQWILGQAKGNMNFSTEIIKGADKIIVRLPDLGKPHNYDELLNNYQANQIIEFGKIGTVKILFTD